VRWIGNAPTVGRAWTKLAFCSEVITWEKQREVTMVEFAKANQGSDVIVLEIILEDARSEEGEIQSAAVNLARAMGIGKTRATLEKNTAVVAAKLGKRNRLERINDVADRMVSEMEQVSRGEIVSTSLKVGNTLESVAPAVR